MLVGRHPCRHDQPVAAIFPSELFDGLAHGDAVVEVGHLIEGVEKQPDPPGAHQAADEVRRDAVGVPPLEVRVEKAQQARHIAGIGLRLGLASILELAQGDQDRDGQRGAGQSEVLRSQRGIDLCQHRRDEAQHRGLAGTGLAQQHHVTRLLQDGAESHVEAAGFAGGFALLLRYTGGTFTQPGQACTAGM